MRGVRVFLHEQGVVLLGLVQRLVALKSHGQAVHQFVRTAFRRHLAFCLKALPILAPRGFGLLRAILEPPRPAQHPVPLLQLFWTQLELRGRLKFLRRFGVPRPGLVRALRLLDLPAQVKRRPPQAKVCPVRRSGVGIVLEQLPQRAFCRSEFVELEVQFPLMQQRGFPELPLLGVGRQKVAVAFQGRTRIALGEFRFVPQRLGLSETELFRKLPCRVFLQVAFRLLDRLRVLLQFHHLTDHQSGVLLGKAASVKTLRVDTADANTQLQQQQARRQNESELWQKGYSDLHSLHFPVAFFALFADGVAIHFTGLHPT